MAPKDEEDFAALLSEYEGPETGRSKKRRREPAVGDEVEGRIISIGRDAAFVDLGGKSDGIIDLAELRDEAGELTVAVGDTVSASVVEVVGGVTLKRRFGRGGSAELEQAFAHGLPVEGRVNGVNKGGVEVLFGASRAFCPLSQLDLRPVDDPATLVGQRLRFLITEHQLGARGLDVVVSRRLLLEREQAARAAELRASLKPGLVVRGRVSALKGYGAFVDLGGLEGMLHVSELGFSRVGHPEEVLAVGQEVEVQILALERDADPKRPERISLSLKALMSDPWAELGARLREGLRLSGVVRRLESFGAFVEVAPGVEGLVHVSELGRGKPLRHARDAVKLGAALAVVVLAVDVAARRISLGLADPADDGEAAPAPAAPASLGTFADLLKNGKKKS